MHIETIALIVIEQIIPSQLSSRNKEIMKINEEHMQDQNLKSDLYSTFVLLLMIEQKEMIIDIEFEVQRIITRTETIFHAPHIEIVLTMTKLVHVMITRPRSRQDE